MKCCFVEWETDKMLYSYPLAFVKQRSKDYYPSDRMIHEKAASCQSKGASLRSCGHSGHWRGAVEKVAFVLHWLDGWWITQCSRWQDRNKLMFDTQGGKVKKSENSEEGPETTWGLHGLPESNISSCGLTAVSVPQEQN